LVSFFQLFCTVSVHCYTPRVNLLSYDTAVGIYLGIYYLSVRALLINTNITRAQRTLYISYGSALLLFNTIFFLSNPLLGLMMWIKCRSTYSDGPWQYYEQYETNASFMMLGSVSQSIAIAMADAFFVSVSD
jgi:hypothetical protein